MKGVLLCVLLLFPLPARALALLDAYRLGLQADPQSQAAHQAHAADQEHRALGRAGLLPNLSWRVQSGRNASDIAQGDATQHRNYRSQAQVQVVQRLAAHGEGSRFDEWDSLQRLHPAQPRRMEQADALDDALQRLQGLVGEPVPLGRLQPLAGAENLAPLPSGYEAWRDLAVRHNPALAAARHGLELAQQEVARQRAGHWPTAHLYASSRQSLADGETSIGQRFSTQSVGVQVTLPLYAGGAVQAAVRRASAQLSQAQWE